MILTPHAIVGAALANMFPNEPVLGFGLAFASHYALDMIGHTDYDISNFLDKDTKTVKSIFKSFGAALHFMFIIFDFVAAIFLCFLFFVRDKKSLMITLIGIAGGVLPDLFQFLYYKYKHEPWIFLQKVHDKIHHVFFEDSGNKIFGVFFQFFIPFCFLVIYYFVKNKI
jgi:ABC-type enterochelin transport system permease subunit